MFDPATIEVLRNIADNSPFAMAILLMAYFFYRRAETSEQAMSKLRDEHVTSLQKQVDLGENRNQIHLEIDKERNGHAETLNKTLGILAGEIKNSREETNRHVAALIENSRKTLIRYNELEAKITAKLNESEAKIMARLAEIEKGLGSRND